MRGYWVIYSPFFFMQILKAFIEMARSICVRDCSKQPCCAKSPEAGGIGNSLLPTPKQKKAQPKLSLHKLCM